MDALYGFAEQRRDGENRDLRRLTFGRNVNRVGDDDFLERRGSDALWRGSTENPMGGSRIHFTDADFFNRIERGNQRAARCNLIVKNDNVFALHIAHDVADFDLGIAHAPLVHERHRDIQF